VNYNVLIYKSRPITVSRPLTVVILILRQPFQILKVATHKYFALNNTYKDSA